MPDTKTLCDCEAGRSISYERETDDEDDLDRDTAGLDPTD